MTWGSWMPHKFKIAASGCPRNCAEATIKDFGVVCVDSGYELHVGGNGGIHVRATDLLCKEIGRASCRERSVSVRVDLGGRRVIKKKNHSIISYNIHHNTYALS